jgi:hypothetical protein
MLRELPVQAVITDACQAPATPLTPISCFNLQTGNSLTNCVSTVINYNAPLFHPFSHSNISVHYYTTEDPDPTKPFNIYTNTSTSQVGALLMQGGTLATSYLCKLTATRQNYPTLTKTLLSVFLTLQEFHSTLLIDASIFIHPDSLHPL